MFDHCVTPKKDMLWWKAAMLSLCTLLQICAGGAGGAATKNHSNKSTAVVTSRPYFHRPGPSSERARPRHFPAQRASLLAECVTTMTKWRLARLLRGSSSGNYAAVAARLTNTISFMHLYIDHINSRIK
jgi:hypothetical protein